MLPWRAAADVPPTAPVGVLLASTGVPIPPAAVEQAAALARGRPVAVVSIARLHGYAFGMPNPGLMPTRRERAAQLEIVSAAVSSLERVGCDADGQVIVTRNAGKALSRAATRRGAEHVVVVTPERSPLRRFIEGDDVAAVRRRVGGRATVRPAGS